MKIRLFYQTERFVWGRREYNVHRGIVIEAGETFAVWHTREEGDAVRFSVEQSPYCHCTAEDFVVHKGEEVAFTCSERYECAEDRLEDVITGTAEIIE